MEDRVDAMPAEHRKMTIECGTQVEMTSERTYNEGICMLGCLVMYYVNSNFVIYKIIIIKNIWYDLNYIANP